MTRLYALAIEIAPKGRRRYYRISYMAYPKPVAVRFFQNALLEGSFSGHSMALRPVTEEQSLTAPGVSPFFDALDYYRAF